jgi:hypothetical protein
VAVLYVSWVVELGLAAALLLVRRRRTSVGWVVAAFIVLVFPGSISQLVTQTDAFGLDTRRRPRDPTAVPAVLSSLGAVVHRRVAGVAWEGERVKLTVVRGWLDHTPELVDGLGGWPVSCPSTSSCCSTLMPNGSPSWGRSRTGCSGRPDPPRDWSRRRTARQPSTPASAVLLQFRVGGQQARAQDETFRSNAAA